MNPLFSILRWRTFLTAFGLIAFGAWIGPNQAGAEAIRLEQATFPIPFLLPGTDAVDGVIEASGVEPIGDGKLLLVAHDKATPLRVVETATGKQVVAGLTCPSFPNEAPIAPKWEGMARDDQGNFYVVGAHAGKTDEVRTAQSFLYRFRLDGGTASAPLSIDNASVRRWRIDSALKAAVAADTRDESAVARRKIEGLTVRTLRGSNRVELVIGLREPGDLVRAYAADITRAPDNGAELALKPLFSFDAGRREGVAAQLTSLEYVPEWSGFFVTTATESEDNAFHGNTLWFLADDRIAAGATPEKVGLFEVSMKVEGLAALPGQVDDHLARLILTFDNDPHATHIPSRFQVVTVRR